MNNIIVACLVIMFFLLMILIVCTMYLNAWSNKVDQEMEMVSHNIENYEKRIKSLERITIDIEQDISKEVYRQLNIRIIEDIYNG